MKITLIQTDIKWADPAANAAHIQQMMTEAPKSDIYVLPEMWSTGFAAPSLAAMRTASAAAQAGPDGRRSDAGSL